MCRGNEGRYGGVSCVVLFSNNLLMTQLRFKFISLQSAIDKASSDEKTPGTPTDRKTRKKLKVCPNII